MSIPHEPAPAKAVLSILSARWDSFWPGLLSRLEAILGPADFHSDLLPFTQTTYYDAELGTPIFRRLLSFATPLPMDRLAAVKLATNAVENEYAENGRRRFNLDPGYLTRERLVLATGKNFVHRIYLGQGIFADLTLIYRKGRFEALPWTFPDYRTEAIQTILTRIRATIPTQGNRP
ncbi:MAG: hypothetical protein PWP17_182 [Desulfomicrobiaceae bacterium]|nr:hypothetical protein [Desulfomicrobiaceae bacterium]